MQLVTYEDTQGYKRQVYLPDEETDPSLGIPKTTINIEALDWNEIKRELHNALIDRELYTWADVQRSQTGITSIVKNILVKPIIGLYRMEELENG